MNCTVELQCSIERTSSTTKMTEMATLRVTARRFFRAYYILNTTVLLAYLVIRQLAWNSELEERQGFLNIPLEQEIFLLVAIMFAMNYRKKATIDGLVAMFFMYTKTGVLAALYYLDRRIFGWMLAYCAFLFIAVGQPKYDGPDNIFPLNSATMEQEITRNGGYKSSKKRVSWLVYFYADWNDNCLQHDAMVADLSLKFGSETLRFGKVDVNKFPELAREHSIEVSATSSQLPTLILFQGGQEIKRLPWIKEDGKVAKVILDRPGLEAVFMLQDLKDCKKSAFLAKSK